MQFSLASTLKIILITAFCSVFLTHCWYQSKYPSQPLFVEIENMREEVIPLLTIEHGNDFSQEKILLTQLRPQEKRIITLNHEPKRGYSLTADFGNGKSVEACVGKQSENWINHVIITKNGIFSFD